MYSYEIFYEKDTKLLEIHFPTGLGGYASCENSDTSNLNEIKIILLMFTGSQDLYLGV